MNGRIRHIDTAKGILIILMIFHHLPLRYTGIVSEDLPSTLGFIQRTNIFFLSYLMPAFFVITGYCSSYGGSFFSFFKKKIKRLLVPGLLFTIFFRFIEVLEQGGGFGDWKIFAGPYLIATGCDYWFINSMFCASIIYWAISNTAGLKDCRFFVCFFLMLVGILLKGDGITIWSYANTLSLVFFIHLGTMLRMLENTSYYQNIVVFSIMVSILFPTVAVIKQYDFPIITRAITIEWNTIPTFVFMSVTGTLALLKMSKWLEGSSFLNRIGRHSIELYFLHGYFLNNAIAAYVHYFKEPITMNEVLLFVVLILIIVILACMSISYVLNSRCLRWILGDY